MDKLKKLVPCRCGSIELLMIHRVLQGDDVFWIKCNKCGIQQEPLSYESAAEALKAWNTRDWHKAEVKREVRKVLEELTEEVSEIYSADEMYGYIEDKLKELE